MAYLPLSIDNGRLLSSAAACGEGRGRRAHLQKTDSLLGDQFWQLGHFCSRSSVGQPVSHRPPKPQPQPARIDSLHGAKLTIVAHAAVERHLPQLTGARARGDDLLQRDGNPRHHRTLHGLHASMVSWRNGLTPIPAAMHDIPPCRCCYRVLAGLLQPSGVARTPLGRRRCKRQVPQWLMPWCPSKE
jgi:hypothetical protein